MSKGMLPLKLINTTSGPNEIKFRQRLAQTKLLGTAAHYWTPDSLPFAYALACTQIVLLHGKADSIYHEAKEAWSLPDCQLAMQDFRTAYLDKSEILRGWPSLWNEPDKFTDSQDFEYLIDRHADFIKVGFNSEIDQANETWKVLPSLDVPWLYKAVTTWTLGDYLGIKLEDWNKYKPLVRGGKTYDTEDVMTNKPTSGTERKIYRDSTAIFKWYGVQVRDKTLLKGADQFYKCRVNPGSIEGHIDELAKEAQKIDTSNFTPKELRKFEATYYPDRGNLDNAIAPYDEAIGYPRQWRK